MATFRLRRFSCPETLKAIAPRHLVAFLKPYSSFLESRGFKLTDGASIDCSALAGIFVSPGADTPGDLIDSLYYVDEMATHDAMDKLLVEAERAGLSILTGDGHTPADIAIQVWNADRNILERKHAESNLENPRSFETFQSHKRRKKLEKPSSRVLRALEKDLDAWFSKHNRGTEGLLFPQRGRRLVSCAARSSRPAVLLPLRDGPRRRLRRRLSPSLRSSSTAVLPHRYLHNGWYRILGLVTTTVVSLALAAGHTLADVRDAAGHTNVSTTSCYLHVSVEETSGIGHLL